MDQKVGKKLLQCTGRVGACKTDKQNKNKQKKTTKKTKTKQTNKQTNKQTKKLQKTKESSIYTPNS
jgi:cell division protein FtsB